QEYNSGVYNRTKRDQASGWPGPRSRSSRLACVVSMAPASIPPPPGRCQAPRHRTRLPRAPGAAMLCAPCSSGRRGRQRRPPVARNLLRLFAVPLPALALRALPAPAAGGAAAKPQQPAPCTLSVHIDERGTTMVSFSLLTAKKPNLSREQLEEALTEMLGTDG